MASISHLNQFPCKTLTVIQSRTRITSKPGIFAPNTVKVTQKPIDRPRICAGGFIQGKQNIRVRAAIDDEGGPDKEEGSAVVVVEKEEELKPAERTEIDRLKKALVASFYGTERGLKATTETRAEIVELITQLEAKNPTPAPTEALPLLNGKWILAYTSFAGMFPLLAGGFLPLLKVEEISQTIDSETLTVQNSVQFSGPLATTSISTNAKFDVRSPKLVQIKLEEGIIGTPKLTDSIEIPENVEVLGQKIDLTPFKGVINSIQETASSVAKTISSQPPVTFPIPKNTNTESLLLTTYLDEEVRVSRGDAGSVFVLIKEGSSLLAP